MFQPPSRPTCGTAGSCDLGQDHHHDVLGDADAVAEGHLGNGDPVVDRGVQIDVVRTDTGGHRELERRARSMRSSVR